MTQKSHKVTLESDQRSDKITYDIPKYKLSKEQIKQRLSERPDTNRCMVAERGEDRLVRGCE